MKNSKSWNRVLTGAAAVSLAIGTMAPMAFAASATTQYNTRTVNVGSGFTAVVQGLVAQDQGHATEFLPIYYLMQGLGKMGYTVNWNGGTRTLNITTPTGVTVTAPTATVGTPGANQMVIQLNGASVMLAPRVVAKDPASGVMTTFAPIYYLNQALKSAGFTNTYNGQSWTLSGQAASQTGTLSATLSVSNQTNGSGTVASPAVSLNNTAISLSTTLTDSSGNPIPNTAVTFNVSNYGNYPTGYLPTVENASGNVVSGTTQTNAEQYTVYTNASGVAQVSMTGPSGQTYAYEIVATAPYAGTTGGAISSQPAYAEFVVSGQAGISPYAVNTAPFVAALGSSVPISVTLPPNAAGQPQANVLLTLQSSANGAFVSSTGAVLGQEVQVSTNSAGIAQALVSSTMTSGSTPIEVQVINGLPSNVTTPQPTYISFAQAGVAAKINNYSVSTNSPTMGSDAVVSGQLVDAAGNPVPSGQILVTSPNTQSNDFAYVSGTTTTTFPMVSSVAVNTPATAAYGDVVTADSNGNFSFSLTDPRQETQTFSIYPVSNGEVTSATQLNSTVSLNNYSLSFAPSTTLSALSVGPFDSYVSSNSNSTYTGATAQANAGGNTPDIGSSNIATVFVQPQNSAGKHTGAELNGVSETYTLSANNGGQIYSINGTTLTTAVGAITLTYNGTTDSFSVPGQSIGNLTSPAEPTDFSVGVVNATPGNTTLTIQSGSVSSTAAISYTSEGAAYADTFTPASPTINAGQETTVQFTLEDINGNPVPNAIANIESTDTSDPLWIASVNGVALAQSENIATVGTNYVTEPTPIPLGNTSVPYAVNQQGVVTWTSGGNVQAYSNASGVVSLTLQAGGGTYFSGAGVNPTTVEPEPNGNSSIAVWSNENGGVGYDLAFTSSTTQGPSGLLNSQPVDTAQGVIYLTGNVVSLSNISLPSSVVAGNNLTITNTNTTGGTYTIVGPTGWNTADVTATGTTLTTTTGATPGNYTISYTVNGATSNVASFTVNELTGAFTNPYTAPITTAYTAAVPAVIGGGSFTVSGTTTTGTMTVSAPDATTVTVNVTTGDTDATVANEIATAWGGNATWNVSASGSTVTFAQKTATTTTTLVDPSISSAGTTTLSSTSPTVTQGVTGSAVVPQTATITAGSATYAGTLAVDVNGTSVPVSVSAGASSSTVAADIFAALLGNSTVSSNYNLGYTSGGSTVTIQQKVASGATFAVTVTG